ncbi:MAG: PH domain-containing protein [Bacteroidia bacterium]
MNRQRFSCSLDKFSKLITVYLAVFGLALILIPGFFAGDEFPERQWVIRSIGILIILLEFVFYLLSPTEYLLSAEGLLIERRWKPKLIPFDEIIIVRGPAEKELKWTVRTFGNGGLFGYTGRYYGKHIGSMIWYCTRKDKQVIIERKFKLPMVISPDEPAKLIWAWGELKRPEAVNV